MASPRRFALVILIVVVLITSAVYLTRSGFETGSGQASDVSVSIGSPQVNMVTLGGKSSGTIFVGSEVFPITLKSTTDIRVNLTAHNVPAGVWVHFVPSTLTSSPSGVTSEMTIAGAVRPFSPTAVNLTITIIASYQSGASTQSFVVVRSNNVTAIHVPSPIEFSSPVVTQTNATAYQIYGVVYDPSSSNSPSQFGVNTSVAGLLMGNSIEPLPPGFQIIIPNPTLSLAAGNPVYFRIGANVSSVAPGTYVIVLQEIISGQSYQIDLQVVVNPQLRSAG